MRARGQLSHGTRGESRSAPPPRGILQRKCSCGGAAGPSGQCAGCRRGRGLDPRARAPQARLRVSQPGDRYEREADRVARHVMRMPSGGERRSGPGPAISDSMTTPLARQVDDEERDEEEGNLRASVLSLKQAPGGGAPAALDADAVAGAMRGSGEPLSPELRDWFEPRFGHSFSQVRVHTDARAGDLARSLDARAFTLGRDVVFAPGEYRPQSQHGRELIAHELTHVLQQRGGDQTLMRACNCSAITGARSPTSAEETVLATPFPKLVSGDWCVMGPATPTYNCFAWSVGVTSRWVDTEVDTVYGDNDGSLEFSDFDDFYSTLQGLTPVTDSTPADPVVALYGKAGSPTHAALNSALPCGAYTSKLGANLRILHDVYQLEGPAYGSIDRYYT